jgi:hypothetical protein
MLIQKYPGHKVSGKLFLATEYTDSNLCADLCILWPINSKE